jgi:glycosyltransferase involved in cell wall biosynthesis
MTPDITVLVVAYHHENTIAEAIESVLRQTAKERTVVVVSDDASSDATYDRALEAVHDQSVHVVRNSVNLGTMAHYRSLVANVATPYVAILEGDDVWISSDKLERQFRALERRPEAAMSFTACMVVDEASVHRVQPHWAEGRRRLVGVLDLLYENSPASFSNCFFRIESFRRILNRTSGIRCYDWLISLLLAAEADIEFDPIPSTRYKVHSAGQWSGLTDSQKNALVGETLEAFDIITDGLYAPFVEDAKNRVRFGRRA